MAMTSDDIPAHPALEACVRGQAQALLLIRQASPRTAAVCDPAALADGAGRACAIFS
jgi:hypothetical protein